MTNPRTLRLLAILGPVLLGAACSTTRRYPVVPPPVKFVSSTPFMVHVRARADTAANSCQALRITGTVTSMENDTLEFASVTSDQRPRGASDCLAGRPGFVVLSSAPDLQGETTVVQKVHPIHVLAFIGFTAFVTFLSIIG
jgi:hypothetical protein